MRIAATALAVAGMAVAGYVLLVRETSVGIACATGGCETVQGSRYAEVLGVPVAALGLAAYAAVLVLMLVGREWSRLAAAGLALGGVVFGAYLLYLQLAVIGAVCDWCLVNDVLLGVLASVMLLSIRADAARRA